VIAAALARLALILLQIITYRLDRLGCQIKVRKLGRGRLALRAAAALHCGEGSFPQVNGARTM
jgi:hypothetical protein